MICDNTALVEIIKHLSDGGWHSLFSIHNRFRLSPLRILNCMDFLIDSGVLESNEKEVRLILPIKDQRFLIEIMRIYRDRDFNIESEKERFFTEPKITINDFYIPNLELLDSELLAKNK